MGVPRSTVSIIWKNRDKHCETAASLLKLLARLRILDTSVDWYDANSLKNTPTTPELQVNKSGGPGACGNKEVNESGPMQ
ncbi:hypothetical protein E2C01_030183 [Portunus trituberculatus]|uniref:Uncharacterized protein n=1 Tax=Portunus trituberculatus TaxID=210409 RepID=A0A5B7ETJ9_PORTR|nr:hypothetical protein [Portunus trituberculatus]